MVLTNHHLTVCGTFHIHSFCDVTFCQYDCGFQIKVLAFLLTSYKELVFSKPRVGGEREASIPNPKRAQRMASRAVLALGVGTKAQQALKSQYEANKEEHKELSREQRLAEEERKFQLRQEKRKAKHRGH